MALFMRWSFRDPAAAVRFAVAAQTELARDVELPAIRVGINAGPVLYRTGEYLGGQILMTEPVAKVASNEGIPVEEVGVRMMRGVDDPLALYRVTRSR